MTKYASMQVCNICQYVRMQVYTCLYKKQAIAEQGHSLDLTLRQFCLEDDIEDDVGVEYEVEDEVVDDVEEKVEVDDEV